ncbi:ATP-binding protein [Deefgea rivuli]|uniref:ATP-binding protein n=1 Tax=Deefgea rivuli TaxID=400948 RepID=UPI0009FE279A|nr:ATP-binding protein [Deefgea rivuli]
MSSAAWQWLRSIGRRARLMSTPRWLERILPSRLLSRLLWVMTIGVLTSQLIGNVIWANYLKNKSEQEVSAAADHIARGAASAVHFFQSLPPNYRPLVIQQLREMGGTRFFVNVNDSPIIVKRIASQPLSNQVLKVIRHVFEQDLPRVGDLKIDFAWPSELAVASDGMTVAQLPDHWVKNTLLMAPRPAPVLVIQTEIEPGHWLYLATLMPDPYFLDNSDPMPPERWLLQFATLITVLLLSWVVVRWITRPLAALSEAAEAFGKGESPHLPEEGSEEFIRTAHAFGAMRERIQRYLEDREKLFAAISHDLRTPITRLKLRTEMLDDEDLRVEFHEDLDELDMMVKGALQSVKDSDIHENRTRVKLDALIGRMVKDSRMAGHEIAFSRCGLWVMAKPLALKRALSNLIDNALFYGERVEVTVLEGVGKVVIIIRDHGPGVPDDALATLFAPYMRLEHGRSLNHQGHGLGLGIARNIIQAHGGVLELSNHPEGGLQAMITLPQD